MYLSPFSRLFLGLFAAALASAQIRPVPSGSGDPANFPSPSNPVPLGGSSRNRSASPGDLGHLIVLAGKVVLDDGTALTDPVKIERVCFGRPHAEGFTDAKGRFTLTLGQDEDAMADASETPNRNQLPGANPMGGVRDTQLENCELRAVAPGFRSSTISLANHRYLDDPNVGAIVLHRVENVQGLTISATSALAPKEARKAYEKGLEAEKKSKPDEAQKEFQKAVDAYPRYAAAWFELGRVYESRDHFDPARDAYRHSTEADANFVSPYERLYELDARDGKWAEVATLTDKVLHLNPYDFPQAYYWNAFADARLNKLDEAEKSAREAVRLDPQHQNPREWYLLGIILANKQQYAEAAVNLRHYLEFAPEAKDGDKVRQQLAELEKQAQPR